MLPERRNISLALNLSLIVVGMLLLTAASVPLYRMFCEFTGYGGTTVASKQSAARVLEREITVTFNADIDPQLPWEFYPAQEKVTLRIGEQKLVHYVAHNKTNTRIKGHAVYNVVPFAAGSHFVKVDCFCFKEQTLEPGQKVDMPVLFYIAPSLADDPDMKNTQIITLSYTFFPVKTEATRTVP
jgi:cytochrome c oxidase assembly protein subunit 11